MTSSLLSTEDAPFSYCCHINLPASFFMTQQIDSIPLTICQKTILYFLIFFQLCLCLPQNHINDHLTPHLPSDFDSKRLRKDTNTYSHHIIPSYLYSSPLKQGGNATHTPYMEGNHSDSQPACHLWITVKTYTGVICLNLPNSVHSKPQRKKSSLPILTAKYISCQRKEEKPTVFLGFTHKYDKQEMSHTVIKQRLAYT